MRSEEGSNCRVFLKTCVALLLASSGIDRSRHGPDDFAPQFGIRTQRVVGGGTPAKHRESVLGLHGKQADLFEAAREAGQHPGDPVAPATDVGARDAAERAEAHRLHPGTDADTLRKVIESTRDAVAEHIFVGGLGFQGVSLRSGFPRGP